MYGSTDIMAAERPQSELPADFPAEIVLGDYGSGQQVTERELPSTRTFVSTHAAVTAPAHPNRA
ncbi:hypothetical protein ABZ863_18325 [Saccharomonospora sp. NPDC046836]|uniref:hypothetical protein n=1 Tax=Saccharomonospora sp. NPDC046836 TaxID=3156921 RepID=UPI00340480AE